MHTHISIEVHIPVNVLGPILVTTAWGISTSWCWSLPAGSEIKAECGRSARPGPKTSARTTCATGETRAPGLGVSRESWEMRQVQQQSHGEVSLYAGRWSNRGWKSWERGWSSFWKRHFIGEMFPGEWHRHTARVYTVYSIHAKWIMYNCIIIMYIYICTSTNISGGKIVSFKQGRVFRQIHQLHPKSFWPDLATRTIQLKMWWCCQGGPGWNWTGHPYLLSARHVSHMSSFPWRPRRSGLWSRL